MGFLANLTPLKKDRQNFPGVVISLADAPAHTSINSDEKAKKSLDRAPSSENGSAGSLGESSHLTLEALRAEVESDISTSGHDSAYDRTPPPFAFCEPSPFISKSCLFDSNIRDSAGKAKVINRALQDIGMGRYQWELFFLCGFGWTADK